MDQAIAFLATEGCAQFIEWNPLRATPIALPSNAFFVIANSLMRANKAATSDFNHRVIECRLACRIIAKELKQSWREFDRFASLQQALNCSLAEFEVFADQVLQKEIYTRNDVIRALEIDESELENDFLTANTRHILKFKLRQRALHVIQGKWENLPLNYEINNQISRISESIRVVEFRQAAVYSKSVSDLSKLMRESHRSLQEKYECSHVSLNKMVEISDQFGVGARLTGAGYAIERHWGKKATDLWNMIFFSGGADASLPFAIPWNRVCFTFKNWRINTTVSWTNAPTRRWTMQFLWQIRRVEPLFLSTKNENRF